MIGIDLSGKRALVTGASGELGRVMARTLALAGADIAIHYHSAFGKAQKLHAEILSMGRRSILVQADVKNMQSVITLKDTLEKSWQGLDILVLNAVSQYTWKPLLEQDPKDYLDQFESTVMQAVHFCKAFAPSMQTQGYGRIVAINTECTMQCLPTQSAYVAGKRGLDGLLRVLARELGPQGITVNQVAPGWTLSEKDLQGPSAEDQGYISQIPLRRRGTAQEVAHMVAVLSSDLASFTTGAVIPVSGGNVMPTT